jgi:hypothetical protein
MGKYNIQTWGPTQEGHSGWPFAPQIPCTSLPITTSTGQVQPTTHRIGCSQIDSQTSSSGAQQEHKDVLSVNGNKCIHQQLAIAHQTPWTTRRLHLFNLILITNLAWKSATMSRLSEIFDEPSSLMYVCFRCHIYSWKSIRHTINYVYGRQHGRLVCNTSQSGTWGPKNAEKSASVPIILSFKDMRTWNIITSQKLLFGSWSYFGFLHSVLCFVCFNASREQTGSIFRAN